MKTLTDAECTLLMNAIGKRESGNGDGKTADDYSRINSLGYVGRYQFGHMALIDAGLLKPGCIKGRSVSRTLKDPTAWVSGDLKVFLSSPEIQDNAMRKLLAQNESTLLRLGVIKFDTPKPAIAGYLMTAHLLGCGGARDLSKGIDEKDGYGTRASDYYKIGAAVFAPNNKE